MLQNVLTGNAKNLIYLGDAKSVDHACSVLEEGYGDPQKRTYRWSSEERRRLLGKAEYEGDIKTGQQGPQRANMDLDTDTSTLTLTNRMTSWPKQVSEQGTSRAQQITTGKPSTPCKNSDTALTTIRPTPVTPEEHRDAAGGEDHRRRKHQIKPSPTTPSQAVTLLR